jgi:O-antigen ligase
MENYPTAGGRATEAGPSGSRLERDRHRMPPLDWKFVPLALYPIAYNAPLAGRSWIWALLPVLLYFLNRSRIRSLVIPLPFAAFVSLLVLNTAFNDVPRGSGYMVPLLASALASGLIVGNLPPSQAGSALWTMLLLPMIASVLLIAAGVGRAPVGRLAETEGWRGAFDHKNSFGQIAGLLLLLILYRPVGLSVNRLWVLGAVGLLVASRSSTAVLSCAFAISLTALFNKATTRGWRRIGSTRLLFAVAALEISVAYLLTSQILDLVGKDPSLTGRTTIWEGLPATIVKHYVWGHGVGSFWVIDASAQDRARIFETIHFSPGQSHNGWLDVGLDLGLPGLFLVAWLLFIGIRQSARLRTNEEWMLTSLLFFSFVSVTERGIYSVMGLMYIACAVVRSAVGPPSNAR